MNYDVFVYVIDLPPKVNEMVAPCADGFTIYLSAKLSQAGRVQAYNHALKHIERNDWNRENVQIIEKEAHDGTI